MLSKEAHSGFGLITSSLTEKLRGTGGHFDLTQELRCSPETRECVHELPVDRRIDKPDITYHRAMWQFEMLHSQIQCSTQRFSCNRVENFSCNFSASLSLFGIRGPVAQYRLTYSLSDLVSTKVFKMGVTNELAYQSFEQAQSVQVETISFPFRGKRPPSSF